MRRGGDGKDRKLGYKYPRKDRAPLHRFSSSARDIKCKKRTFIQEFFFKIHKYPIFAESVLLVFKLQHILNNSGKRTRPHGGNTDQPAWRMVAVLLLGLSCVCSPLVALVLDYNSIKSSAEVQGTRKSSQCITDQDCNASKFCLKPEDEVSFCATCRGLRRRCKHNAMCCPGTICLNDVCSQTEEVTPTEGRRTDEEDGSDSKGTTQHQIQENNSKKGLVKSPSNKGLDTVL
ncbi:dickkopf-related protein 4 isoform X3 [Dermochelys coriacea]|uniref:dickkopf-related protein 4 isoform X3 n=1 Tax=Dermochelys coriacea TaxID=27794 RepID=UPI001CA8BFB8|nr:dickkopf-related protein 4 isoform X3 [Dermochelys coriacea]